MRIGELARRTGVPVPSIKYYTREGMLPPGERISPNQVQYAESHIRRLKLIRALTEVGGLSIAAAAEVLAGIDSPGTTPQGMLGTAQSAVSKVAAERGTDEMWEHAEREVAELVRRHDWAVRPENPGWRTLVQVVVAYHELDQSELLGLLDRYAQAAGSLAAAELAAFDGVPSLDAQIEGAVLGTVLGDAAMAALRRIAQEDVARRVRERSQTG
ncbi:MerR family transcriptional regulator [Streptomyces lydicus]|uniref:MerR family transcriptional regulator n=1 Tax=Streptomyces lydicus TaxID=47763 RepID=UPI00101190EC|nr:MerR family transcriptional regulator [Streptomyces lydicus]MCZ1010736.1 MerR family transcriptional regulator [Streptomyces lydicus]